MVFHAPHRAVQRRLDRPLIEVAGSDDTGLFEGSLREADMTMTRIHKLLSFGLMGIAALSSAACAQGLRRTPEVGSEAWCEQMNEKPKGDWTGNEATDYARYCLFR